MASNDESRTSNPEEEEEEEAISEVDEAPDVTRVLANFHEIGYSAKDLEEQMKRFGAVRTFEETQRQLAAITAAMRRPSPDSSPRQSLQLSMGAASMVPTPIAFPPLRFPGLAAPEALTNGYATASTSMATSTITSAVAGPSTAANGSAASGRTQAQMSPPNHDMSSPQSSTSNGSAQGTQAWSYEEQYKQVRQLYELSPEPERKAFLDDLFSFMTQRGTPINRLPIMAKHVLDLYELYNLVVARGGLVDVINKKLWQEIIKGLSLPSSITSAAFTLRTQYMKYLYPYECEKKHLSTDSELRMAIEGNKREGRRSSYGTSYDLPPRNQGLASPMHQQLGLQQAVRRPQMNGHSPHMPPTLPLLGQYHELMLNSSIARGGGLTQNPIEAALVDYARRMPPTSTASQPSNAALHALILQNMCALTPPEEYAAIPPQNEALNLGVSRQQQQQQQQQQQHQQQVAAEAFENARVMNGGSNSNNKRTRDSFENGTSSIKRRASSEEDDEDDDRMESMARKSPEEVDFSVNFKITKKDDEKICLSMKYEGISYTGVLFRTGGSSA